DRSPNSIYQAKITTILMLDSGFKSEDIAESLGIDARTVFRYQAEYLAMKLEDDVRTARHWKRSSKCIFMRRLKRFGHMFKMHSGWMARFKGLWHCCIAWRLSIS
ncbi:MAG: hypothetical protein ACUVRP_01410, partial [Chlorobiales bacterium]